MNEKREQLYIGALTVLSVFCIYLSVKTIFMMPERVENKVNLEINGKLVLTMTNNCVFIEQTK